LFEKFSAALKIFAAIISVPLVISVPLLSRQYQPGQLDTDRGPGFSIVALIAD
jgi:hypothetical protein